MSDDELRALRAEIDEIDDELVALLDRRARLAPAVARIKARFDLPIRDPAREEAILQRLVDVSDGPFPPEHLRRVFRAVFEGSIALQERDGEA